MTRILVPTFLHDLHATAVAAAIERKGHSAVLWHGADLPTRQTASIGVDAAGAVGWELRGPALDAADRHFDVVWTRRLAPPLLPDGLPIPESDRYIADRECQTFYSALWLLVAPDAFWVNPRDRRARANCKPLQLSLAARLGLQVPPTLCSNDPERIRAFLREHGGRVVYKPFRPAQWERGDDGIALQFASLIGADDLPEDEVLRLSPGIFQPRVPKRHELRVTVIGDLVVAVTIHSQERALTELDWKHAFSGLRIERTELHPELERTCRALLRELGIVFGCIDLIVTPAGEVVFLELNEMGQFLWLEEIDPTIKLLDPFCEMLIQRRPDFTWRDSPRALGFLELRDDCLRRQETVDAALHVPSPRYHVARESPAGGALAGGSTLERMIVEAAVSVTAPASLDHDPKES